ncbi:GNAT family N-acetyltransferase [Streptomyces sedi]|uniref:GNAT family N-acetyltransferase n=1 Tax=Streptomyces sedi TaxID=555059 RepID=A0A5C4UY55_9ACTN|nr:GNAT family N-acetyltransferase [Streptomyces sedi]TNM28448.1 GNAT family N-acetyltransferase [Streptomyces sedi]
MAELELRDVAGDRDASGAWVRAVFAGFLDRGADVSQEEIDVRLARQSMSRARGFFEKDRCVATFNSFDQRLTTVGGAELAANAVSAVTVTGTHRRRGLLTRLMEADLRNAKERGDAVASLIAAEYRIYGRYGFGPATSFVNWRVLTRRAALDPRWSPADVDGELAMVEDSEAREVLPELHRRFRARTPGAVERGDFYWDRITGAVETSPPRTKGLNAVYRDASGVVRGLVSYTVEKRWEQGLSDGVARVTFLYAEDDVAERALYRLLLSLDWVSVVDTGAARPDSTLPMMLGDRRAATVAEVADFLWLRPLDVPAMLTARSYAAEGELVLEVGDAMGLAGGRFLLTAGEGGATCVPTTRSADIGLDVAALSRLYLGEESAALLAACGLLSEETNGAATRADLLFHTGRRPWCPDIF